MYRYLLKLIENGRDGSVIYILFDPLTGNIIQCSETLYEPVVESFEIIPEFDDGVIEPSEQINICNIVVSNRGGIVLPVGTCIFIEPTKNFSFIDNKPSKYYLTEPLQNGNTTTIPIVLSGKIGTNISPSHFAIHSSLLKRNFPSTKYYTFDNVQYPIYFDKIEPISGTRGIVTYSIKVTNRSTVPYGGERGSIQLLVESGSGVNVLDYTSVLQNIEPNESINFELMFDITDIIPFYERVKWKSQLLFRGDLIQLESSTIRCVPTFNFDNPFSDALILIGSPVSRTLFDNITDILTQFDLSFQIWDKELYNNLSLFEEKPAPWISNYKGKLIILIANSKEDLQTLDQLTIYKHFYDDSGLYSNSGLLFLSTAPLKIFEDHLFSSPDVYKAMKLTDDLFSDWYSISRVSKSHMKKKCGEIVKVHMENSPKDIARVHVINYNPSCIKSGLVYKRWKYGDAEIRTLTLPRTCRARGITIADSTQKVLAKGIIESLSLHSQLNLLNSDISKRVNTLVGNGRKWLKSLILTILYDSINNSNDWSDLKHATKHLFPSPQPDDFIPERYIIKELIAILYKLRSLSQPSWISLSKKQTRKRLEPLDAIILKLESAIPSKEKDKLLEKSKGLLPLKQLTTNSLWTKVE